MLTIQDAIAYKFSNEGLLNEALHHSSIKKYSAKFERLEFLGDRVLGLVIAEYIFRKFQKDNEGILARMHSAFVCADACYKVALKIGIGSVIKTGGDHLKQNKTVLADAIEAVIGAVFIDGGFGVASRIILNLWEDLFDGFDKSSQDPKTKLQEITQAKTGETPLYTLISVTGPDHNQSFVVSAKALEKEVLGTGKSIKLAEIDAAKKLLEALV